jgi:hypothetical protein
LTGFASLDPSYALMEWAEAIGFDAREAIKRLAKFRRK